MLIEFSYPIVNFEMQKPKAQNLVLYN